MFKQLHFGPVNTNQEVMVVTSVMPSEFDHHVIGKQQSVRNKTEWHIHPYHKLLAIQIEIRKTPDEFVNRSLGSQVGMQDIVILQMDFNGGASRQYAENGCHH
ncbi:MAG: hypothetical protein KUF74_15855 [Candidatus Thiodiazotropha sp. (ex Ctena orbiculata)]|nr:hypothetical protein [Candidatus Thiodiazotropha taylori]